jgi:CDP-diacylglycerol--glycerol-3-phosphate 3-phosphatidyltransferase
VLREALLDLAGLLACVDVQRKRVGRRVAADLLEPAARAGPNGVRRQADTEPGREELLDLVQVGGNRWLAEALQAAAPVRRIEQHELDPGCLCSLRRGVSLAQAEIVKLPDGRVTRCALLAIDPSVRLADRLRRLAGRLRQHRVAPGPEVGAGRAPPQSPLEAVRVGVDEAREGQRASHGAILAFFGSQTRRLYPCPMGARAVPAPIAQLPNALTILRFALVPVFVVLLAGADDGQSWAAAAVFAMAAITDQVDGWLARRLRVESQFGKYADPLADRLMIDVAVVMLFLDDRLPWAALIIIVGRDLLLVLGTRLALPRGYEFSVSFLGKLATWILYLGIGLVIATEPGTDWPLVIFWIGVGLAVAAAVSYALAVWRSPRQ